MDLAGRVVTDFHSGEAARAAAEGFEARFGRGELVSGDLPQVRVEIPEGSIGLAKLLSEAGMAESSSDAARKIQQGGVRVNRERVIDPRARISAESLPLTLEVGRRALRVLLG
jgi:tyrosyl-tRNA synthetase